MLEFIIPNCPICREKKKAYLLDAINRPVLEPLNIIYKRDFDPRHRILKTIFGKNPIKYPVAIEEKYGIFIASVWNGKHYAKLLKYLRRKD